MELTSEDLLRLNVLAVNADAIRLNENTLELFGRKGSKEMKVQLHPTGNQDRYVKQVREVLATVALDSPGGYPVFIQRWTRMGQVDSTRLANLLRLAEPEAVMAVVCSPGLTNELAQLAWWCEPHAEYARRLLEQPDVATGKLGPELAAYLVEHLPFETEPQQMLETVRLVLQPGLIDDTLKQRLWNRGRTTKSYRVGFLETLPDQLPEQQPPHPALATNQSQLQQLADQDNPYARLLMKLLDSTGQSFANTAADVLTRPGNQDIVTALFKAVGDYLKPIRTHHAELRQIEAIVNVVESLIEKDTNQLHQLWSNIPALHAEIRAMLFLAHLDDSVLTPILSLTDAVGTVLRKKIEPVSSPLLANLDQILAKKRSK
ncbi:MAG: sulfur reduction protein DsrS [Sedimenticola sp.]|nr:sulfur reduction protein DsrS [Sedimenticola sp.]